MAALLPILLFMADHLTNDIDYYIFSAMKPARRNIHPLLERMIRIERMERGKVCRMSGRTHCNHQTWQDGHNVVRYVPADEVASLQAAIAGYRLFMELARQYSDQIIQRTRSVPLQTSALRQRSTRQK